MGSLTPSARADGRTLSARQARDSRGKRNRKYQTRPSDRPPQPTGDGPHCQLLGHPPAECRSLTRPPRTLSHFWWSGLAWGPPPAHLHLGCTLAPQPSVSPAWGEQAHFHQRGKRILSKTSTHVLGSLPRGRTRQGLVGAAATPAGRDAPWPCTVWARTRGALKERRDRCTWGLTPGDHAAQRPVPCRAQVLSPATAPRVPTKPEQAPADETAPASRVGDSRGRLHPLTLRNTRRSHHCDCSSRLTHQLRGAPAGAACSGVSVPAPVLCGDYTSTAGPWAP